MSTTITASCTDCPWTGGPYRSQKMADYAASRHNCDLHRARAAHAAQAADAAAERERLIDRRPQPCLHKRANQVHGSYVTYTQDRCRCRPCCDAASTYNRGLSKRNAYGRSNLVDADPVRDHIKTLGEAGIGLKTITRHTGINGGVLCKLIYGVPETGRRPSRKIKKTNAAKILALDPRDPSLIAGGARIDSTGTSRRLQALVAMGWSQSKLARQLGLTPTNFCPLVNGTRPTTAARARAVRDLYDRLWNATPPRQDKGDKVAYTRARRHAQAHGWAPPLAWDDDTIDDPAATPDLGEAVDIHASHRRLHLEDLEWLATEHHLTIGQACDRFGVGKSAVEYACKRAGRRDLLDLLIRNAVRRDLTRTVA